MNTKVVYAAGIAILMIGIIFYIINSGFFSSENPSISSLNNSKTSPNTVKPTTYLSSSPSQSSSNIVGVADQQGIQNKSNIPQQQSSQQQSSQKQVSPSNYDNLTVSMKSVDIVPINNVTYVQIALNVHNPNRGAAILETLSYGIYFDNVRLASADIGSKPQGFIDSLSSVYPIIGNQTITLKDKQPLTSEGNSLFNSNGTLIKNYNSNNSNSSKTPIKPNSFVINGTFSTTLARGTQSQSSETPFNLQFPLK
jgi:hypothetical protein